jgi:hypothetical protein
VVQAIKASVARKAAARGSSCLADYSRVVMFRTFLARSAVVGVTLVVLTGAAAGVPAGGAVAATPEVQVSGGSAAQRELARQILARMGATRLRSVKIGPVPSRYGDQARTLSFLTLTTRDGIRRQGEWESKVFAGAFADFSQKRQLPTVFGLRTPGSGGRLGGKPGFRSLPLATAAGAVALAAQVTQAVSATAGASDVKVVSLQILKPEGLAFALVLRVSDPAAYMKHQLGALLAQSVANPSALGSPFFAPALEGAYFVLQDAGGSKVWTYRTSTRTGSSGGFTDPSLRGCDPIPHGGPFGYSPPGCPGP